MNRTWFQRVKCPLWCTVWLLLWTYGDTAQMVKNHASCIRHCDICGLTFKKIPEYERHLAGRRHKEMVARSPSPEAIWSEFEKTHWSTDCNVTSVAAMWQDSELSSLGLKYRSTCLHPSPVVGKLNNYQRARIWRYIRDAMGLSYYSELANILAAADADTEGHLRVKELFESLESFKVIANFIVAAQRTGEANGYPPIESIVELACGHGLVGCLLAYRFPKLKVVLFDLKKRPTYDAFLRAFETHGYKHPGYDTVLPNIEFFEEDLGGAQSQIRNSVVVCLHGCGEVNERAIEMAISGAASGWAVMPCCIEKEQYLGSECLVSLSDDQARYSMLCGALASKYGAQSISAIDSRITNRPIVIAGGVGNNVGYVPDSFESRRSSRSPSVTSDDGSSGSIDNSGDGNTVTNSDLENAVKRGRMPKLVLS